MLSAEAVSRSRGGCTFPWQAKLLGSVLPRTADEAATCLKLAGETGCRLHPISRGRAWGLGSALPPRDAVLLDLSRLDRILDVDEVHGTVRVEPGVTFAQLEAALAARGSVFQVPSFGGPPDASVLANALDRGEGSGAMGDRFAHLWDLDVALTTGERLRTGYGRFGRAGLDALARTHGRPAGPLLEGLFSQSGFGCVLAGQMALARRPRHAAYLTCEIGDVRALPPVVEAVRRLVHEDVLGAHDVFFWDGAKQLSATALRAELVAGDPRLAGLRDWAASIGVSAHHRLLFDGRIALILEALTGLAEGIDILDGETEPELAAGLRGHSDGANLKTCYWAKRLLGAAPLDPDRDGCGFLWYCPVLPFCGQALGRLDRIAAEVAEAFDIFVATGAEVVSPRALIAYVSLAWDREVAGADDHAMAAHDVLARRCAAAGFHPYRLALPTIGQLPKVADSWADVTRRLRRALDPQGLLGAGRLGDGP